MCENPVDAWLDMQSVNPETGKNKLLFSLPKETYDLIVCSGSYGRYRPIQVPCGKCFSCRRDRAWHLTVRASFESRLYEHNTFITLTCADAFLPEVFPNGVEHRPWQLFAKKLRKKIGPFRFLMCAEYGSKTCRPHYHAIIFGHEFHDSVLLPDGSFVPSKLLAETWTYGHVQCDELNENRVAYVAGYTLKDYQLGRDSSWYSKRGLNLPYVRWSRRPGLGYEYFKKWWPSLVKHKDLWQDGEHYDNYLTTAIFSNSERLCGCRYFVDKLQLLSPSLYDKIQASKLDKPYNPVKSQIQIDNLLRSSKCRQYALSMKERDLTHNIGNVN